MKDKTGVCAECGRVFQEDELVGVAALDLIASLHGGCHDHLFAGKFPPGSKFCSDCRGRVALSADRVVSDR